MAEPAIRPANSNDAEAVFALLVQLVTSYAPRREAFDRHFPKLGACDHAVFLVAEGADDQVVGYVLGSIALTLYANGPVLELQELMVAPAHRGKTIGRRLVEAAIACAHAAGCVEVTAPTRRARDFYINLGFEETAVYMKCKL